jgi:hypothetical protein
MSRVENISDQGESQAAEPSMSTTGRSSQLPEWQLVRRIVASTAFSRSTLLTNFLLYVCDRKLHGREDEVTEYQIGVHALGRPENYHPGEDNIVRNYARILRKRLEEYFEEEGKHEAMRIVIPRGQYLPIFEPVVHTEELVPRLSQATAIPTPEEPTAPPVRVGPGVRPNLRRRKFLISASMATAALAAGWLGFHEKRETLPERLFRRFWAQLFDPKSDSFIVTGDSGLVLFEHIAKKNVPLKDYVSGKAALDFRELATTSPFAKDVFGNAPLPHYTSTADLNIAIALDRLAMSVNALPKIRSARDMRMDDVKRSNCIFIGGPRANPWIELFEPRSNFEIKFPPAGESDRQQQEERSILNKRPKPGEQSEYANSTYNGPSSTYTTVSFLPGIQEGKWVLLLKGAILSGTGAAGDFVTNMTTVAPVLEKAQRSDGGIGPFELILQTQAIGADAPQAHIIVERYEAFNG